MKLLRTYVVAVGALALLGVRFQSSAAALTASMPASIVIAAGCSSFTAGSLNFGSAATNATKVLAQSTVSISCATGVSYSIQSDGGQLDICVDNMFTHQMSSSAGSVVTYRIFIDANESTLLTDLLSGWCNNGGLTMAIAGSGSGSSQNYTLYGSAYPSEFGGYAAPAGSYSDTILLTVSF